MYLYNIKENITPFFSTCLIPVPFPSCSCCGGGGGCCCLTPVKLLLLFPSASPLCLAGWRQAPAPLFLCSCLKTKTLSALWLPAALTGGALAAPGLKILVGQVNGGLVPGLCLQAFAQPSPPAQSAAEPLHQDTFPGAPVSQETTLLESSHSFPLRLSAGEQEPPCGPACAAGVVQGDSGRETGTHSSHMAVRVSGAYDGVVPPTFPAATAFLP